MNCRYKAWYLKEFPIGRLTLIDKPHLYFDGMKTGGMTKEAFLSLKDDIETNGLINPIVVEVDSGPKYRIAMGNNRVEAALLLGYETIKVVAIHRCTEPMYEDGTAERLTDDVFLSRMKELHPGDELWKKSAWAQFILKFIAEKTNDPTILKVA